MKDFRTIFKATYNGITVIVGTKKIATDPTTIVGEVRTIDPENGLIKSTASPMEMITTIAECLYDADNGECSCGFHTPTAKEWFYTALANSVNA